MYGRTGIQEGKNRFQELECRGKIGNENGTKVTGISLNRNRSFSLKWYHV